MRGDIRRINEGKLRQSFNVLSSSEQTLWDTANKREVFSQCLNYQKEPEKYGGLTVRVAGYTAYFTELASDLQDEIIARTSYGE